MELAPGGDLLDYIRRKGHLSENRSRVFFAQLLEALEYLHSMDIAHRYVLVALLLEDFQCSRFHLVPSANSN